MHKMTIACMGKILSSIDIVPSHGTYRIVANGGYVIIRLCRPTPCIAAQEEWGLLNSATFLAAQESGFLYSGNFV